MLNYFIGHIEARDFSDQLQSRTTVRFCTDGDPNRYLDNLASHVDGVSDVLSPGVYVRHDHEAERHEQIVAGDCQAVERAVFDAVTIIPHKTVEGNAFDEQDAACEQGA